MPLFPGGPAGDAFAGAFGIAAATLIVGGPILLRWQRNRQQFSLMRTALERGVTQLPQGEPFWLLSLRQGLLMATFGASLMIVSVIAYGSTRRATMPAIATTQPSMAQDEPPPREEDPHRFDRERPRPPAPDPAMEQWHRTVAIRSTAHIGLGAGFILLMLGTVRSLFSRVERRHFAESRAVISRDTLDV